MERLRSALGDDYPKQRRRAAVSDPQQACGRNLHGNLCTDIRLIGSGRERIGAKFLALGKELHLRKNACVSLKDTGALENTAPLNAQLISAWESAPRPAQSHAQRRSHVDAAVWRHLSRHSRMASDRRYCTCARRPHGFWPMMRRAVRLPARGSRQPGLRHSLFHSHIVKSALLG